MIDPQDDQNATQIAPVSNTPDASQQPVAQPTPAPGNVQPQQPPQASATMQPQPAQPSANMPATAQTSTAHPPTVSNAPAQPHPAVQRASLIHDIAATLSGGPRYQYSIDPTTGATTRTELPVSGKLLALSIALEALSGSITGLAQRGPNHSAAAAAAGYQQGQQQAQQVQQQNEQAEQQANANFVRGVGIANTNFQTYQNALRLGQMEYDAHKQFVTDAAPTLDALNQTGAVLASGVAEGDLLPKYHVTKNLAVVDGIVPRMDADGNQAKNLDGSLAWDNTYSVIDPNVKITIPDATAQLLAAFHVPGYFRMVDGKATPIQIPDNAQVAARLVLAGLATASSIKITEQNINRGALSVSRELRRIET